jgi:hypothetical protein
MRRVDHRKKIAMIAFWIISVNDAFAQDEVMGFCWRHFYHSG